MGFDSSWILPLAQEVSRVEHQSCNRFVEIDIRPIFEDFINNKEGYASTGGVNRQRFEQIGKAGLKIHRYYIQLFFLPLFDEYFVHIDEYLKLVRKKIVFFQFLQSQILRKDLLDKPRDDEIRVKLVTEAADEGDYVDELVYEGQILEINVDGNHYVGDFVIYDLVS